MFTVCLIRPTGPLARNEKLETFACETLAEARRAMQKAIAADHRPYQRLVTEARIRNSGGYIMDEWTADQPREEAIARLQRSLAS